MEQAPYSVTPNEDGFEVRLDTNRVILTCRGEQNAEHYQVLLNQAYKVGFKAGQRAAREARS